jgi:L-aspartate oxidase
MTTPSAAVPERKFDFLVVGSGLAGLSAAFTAAQHGTVALLCKSTLDQSSSYWAQGGIAAAIDPEDSAYFHFDDTIACGRGLCRNAAVEILVGEGVERVRELIRMGMKFDEGADMGLAPRLEGGHSKRRILHADGNATGRAVPSSCSNACSSTRRSPCSKTPRWRSWWWWTIAAWAAWPLIADNFAPWLFTARATMVATGGAAGNFSRTTNPPTSSGDGIALAYRAGAEVCDMEFVQFHPTGLYTESGPPS